MGEMSLGLGGEAERQGLTMGYYPQHKPLQIPQLQ